jgi:hypothetical protein
MLQARDLCGVSPFILPRMPLFAVTLAASGVIRNVLARHTAATIGAVTSAYRFLIT